MIPAFTAANLFAWSIQVVVVVLVGGGAIRLAGLQSPRVRLACFRALLIACLLLPFLPLGANDSVGEVAPTTRPSNAWGFGHTASSTAAALSVDVTPANASPAAAAPGEGRVAWLPGWAVVAAVIIVGLGMAARLLWLMVGLLALRRVRSGAGGTMSGADPCVGPLFGRRRGTVPPVIDRAIDLAGATADIRTSAAVTHPVTFGLRRPVVLLPESYASLDEREQVAVVCHELLHVRRRDWLHTVAEEMLRALLWFNPAIWWLLARIDLSREQLVDQDVVALTEHRQPYLNALVTLALTPVGPVLRPASLFLGRAHLIQRVALLSREVRMSRPRLCLSLMFIIVALIASGRLVIHAFPLTVAASSSAATSAVAMPAPPVPGAVSKTGSRLALGAAAASASAASPQNRTVAEVLQRFEPVVATQPSQPGADTIVAMQVTVQPSGELLFSGPVEMFTAQHGKRGFEAKASDGQVFERMMNQDFGRRASTTPYATDEARAAFDALRTWQFAPGEKPFTTVVGFNLTRSEQSGAQTVPVRIGGGVPAPRRIRNVSPVYPMEAQHKRTQGVVILELTIDGAGIPIDAYALRPVEGLTMAAVQAALQWRYEPDANYSRRLMTVTVNFNLGGVTGGIVGGAPNYPPPPPPPPPDAVSGVAGGVRGGVVGGVVSGVQGGIAGGVASGAIGGVVAPESFGLLRSEWPSNAIRVGGEIRAPTRVMNVNPIYPAIAQTAKVQGVVIIEVLIGDDGTVQAGQILRSIPLLDQAALDAVRQWRYTRTLLNGTPVPVIMTVTANFTLQ